MKEYELFPILKDYFINQGYKVNAEVKDCDMTAVRGDELLIVEMKTSLNITVLYQALERKKLSPNVYIAIPRPKRDYRKLKLKMKNLVSKLDLGLIVVDVVNKGLEVIVQPQVNPTQYINSKKKTKLLTEINNRSVDENVGGKNRTKVLTAYKELGIALCVVIKKEGQVNTKTLREKYGFDPKTTGYLHKNVFRWYKKVGTATYELSKEGEEALLSKEYINAVKFYETKYLNVEID